MRSLCRAALALALAGALAETLAQSVPVPAAGLPPAHQPPAPATRNPAPLLAPAPAAGESAPNAKPQGIYATIERGETEAAVHRLGQLIPYPRREAIAAAVAVAPRLAPPALYALANAVALDDATVPDAVFWFHVARIRAVYDAQRCKDASARSVVGEFGKRLNPDAARYQRQHRQHTLQIAELAIQWDQKNPRNYDHRWINLYGKVARTSDGTDPAELTVPESEWPAILQRVHEAHLKSVREFAAGRTGN